MYGEYRSPVKLARYIVYWLIMCVGPLGLRLGTVVSVEVGRTNTAVLSTVGRSYGPRHVRTFICSYADLARTEAKWHDRLGIDVYLKVPYIRDIIYTRQPVEDTICAMSKFGQ